LEKPSTKWKNLGFDLQKMMDSISDFKSIKNREVNQQNRI
jgi:hypothetical protein